MPRNRRRRCAHCKQEEAWVRFGVNLCKACFLELNAEFDAPSKRRLGKYGLKDQEFAMLFLRQKGRCAICEEEDELVIDHDHETGKVRGLLCGRCNAGLGMFRDDKKILNSAVQYLYKPSTHPDRMRDSGGLL